MFGYYLISGLRSLRRNPVLTALMVFGIALGIAASMTSLTVFHLMGSDPIPWKSDRLHVVQLDNWDINQAYDEEKGRLPDQLTYLDATALMAAAKADRQVAMYKVVLPVQPADDSMGTEVKPWMMLGRATYRDFFPMFEPPFRFGAPWSRDQDAAKARVTVLPSGATNVQDLMKSSAALLTDYSSVGFDFSMLERPVFYLQFDRRLYLAGGGSHLDLDAQLPGRIAFSRSAESR